MSALVDRLVRERIEVVGMHGGMKFYRGSATAARAYVEADHSRADDYYLAEGSGVATRYVAVVSESVSLKHGGELDGQTYERWVAGYDVETGAAKGRLRDDANALRFVEVSVNGPKTWSLAAALYPEVSAALDAAQDRAAEQIITWVAAHATTRVGPRGRQVQVPVEQIEAATIRHYTSRAGDPHRHLHLQINARVFAARRWRGLHSVGARDELEALNGIGHAAVATDPGFRAALADHGLTLDPATAELVELAPYAPRFSARAAQISRNIEQLEAEWRSEHPGEDPGPRLRQAWDRRAWAQARPDKVVPKDGAAMVAAWNHELRRLGFRDPHRQTAVVSPRVGELDRDSAVDLVLSRLAAKRSAWNAGDIRGQVEWWIAQSGLVAGAAGRIELAEDLTARAVASCTLLLDRDDVPEHVRALTSPRVIDVEDRITRLLGLFAYAGGQDSTFDARTAITLDPAQRAAVAALAGSKHLLVIEGAAGAGKTTTLTVTKERLARQEHRLMVVTPTLKAAEVAAGEIDAPSFSAAWLIHQWGWRWDDDGHWTHTHTEPLDPRAMLGRGDLLVVDEAGMLDQDTACALLEIIHVTGARVAFMGDRHQLPAVGRGGVLDLAAQHAGPDASVSLDVVHRFTDPEYAAISLAMRRGEDLADGESVFEALWRRKQFRLHASEPERIHALAHEAAEAILAGHTNRALMADSREHVTVLNGAIRDRLVAEGLVSDDRVVVNETGQRLGVGDRVATRRNHWQLGVANRQTWTITNIDDDTVRLRNDRGRTREVPVWYAHRSVELAYATTVYGAQGDTKAEGHLVMGETTSAASAYVGMTRGRHDNVAHLVADGPEQARAIWEQVLGRDRADLGVAHARLQAIDTIDRYGPDGSAKLRAQAVARQRAQEQSRAQNRREFERRHTEPAEPAGPNRTGPGIGF
ncbi:MobF family relaxase [Intrasporangium chromatireducens]|nr:MobF family relaxase [Intrasporangium chromatireducens]